MAIIKRNYWLKPEEAKALEKEGAFVNLDCREISSNSELKVIVGAVAGIIPARNASSVAPVEALRYE